MWLVTTGYLGTDVETVHGGHGAKYLFSSAQIMLPAAALILLIMMYLAKNNKNKNKSV